MNAVVERKRAVKPKNVAPLRPQGMHGGMTTEEMLADMLVYAQEVSKNKRTAVASLKSAGIFDKSGQYAAPFRSK